MVKNPPAKWETWVQSLGWDGLQRRETVNINSGTPASVAETTIHSPNLCLTNSLQEDETNIIPKE